MSIYVCIYQYFYLYNSIKIIPSGCVYVSLHFLSVSLCVCVYVYIYIYIYVCVCHSIYLYLSIYPMQCNSCHPVVM